MGLRGVGAKPKIEKELREIDDDDKALPWNAPGLKRWERVVAFCEDLKVTSGPLAGQRLTLRPWQRQFIKHVYHVDKDGKRPVRTAVLSMGRKNGKTQLASALALCHLCGPESEPRGEVYSCANDRFQASKIYSEMMALVDQSPWLTIRTNSVRFKKEIQDLGNGSVYAALTSEARTKFGLSPSFVVYDELGQSDQRTLYDAMDSAMGGRKEPLMLVISTQAADDFAPMSQLIDYGLKINRKQLHDPAFHLTLFSAADDANPWSVKSWRAANPALDDFRSLEDVMRLAQQAQRMPAQENAFRNLILNQRVAAEARFVDQNAWKECGGPVEIPEGAPVYAGLDLGATRDMTALVIAWCDPKGVYHVRPWFWLPGDPRARGDEDRAPYDAWHRKGELMLAGTATDPGAVAVKIAEVNGKNRIEALAFDRWRMDQVKRELDAIGCRILVEPHGQGFKDMTSAVDAVERLIAQGNLRHGMHPVLTWNAANAVVTRDAQSGRKFDKGRSNGRIDGIVAMSMALNLAINKKTKPIDLATLIA